MADFYTWSGSAKVTRRLDFFALGENGPKLLDGRIFRTWSKSTKVTRRPAFLTWSKPTKVTRRPAFLTWSKPTKVTRRSNFLGPGENQPKLLDGWIFRTWSKSAAKVTRRLDFWTSGQSY